MSSLKIWCAVCQRNPTHANTGLHTQALPWSRIRDILPAETRRRSRRRSFLDIPVPAQSSFIILARPAQNVKGKTPKNDVFSLGFPKLFVNKNAFRSRFSSLRDFRTPLSRRTSGPVKSFRRKSAFQPQLLPVSIQLSLIFENDYLLRILLPDLPVPFPDRFGPSFPKDPPDKLPIQLFAAALRHIRAAFPPILPEPPDAPEKAANPPEKQLNDPIRFLIPPLIA